MKRVVIIGAGIAGLATAWSLREHCKEPLEILLLEKKGELGGNIKTEKADGFLVEGGPDCFLSEKPWAMELCRRIGLGERLLPTNDEHRKTFVLSGGKLRELPEGVILMVPTRVLPLLTSSLISIPGKIRMGLEYFIPRRKDKGDESLGDFVRRRLGREALEKIAEPLVAGVHAGDPETMSVRASFPRFVQLEEDYGSLIKGMLARMHAMRKARREAEAKGEKRKEATMFMTLIGGLSELIQTLAERLKGSGNISILTGAAATKVLKKNDGYAVHLEGRQPAAADAVIIATPAYAASALIKDLDREVSEKLLTIPYVSTATVSLGYRKKEIRHPLNGFGFVVPRTEGRNIMASTWTSVKFRHRAPDDSVLIRCFVGGSKRAELVSLNDKEMVEMVKKELRDIMGIDAEPALSRVYRWVNAMPQYTIGHEERVASIEERMETHPGLFLTGSAYHGIGISDSIRHAEVTAKKTLHYLT